MQTGTTVSSKQELIQHTIAEWRLFVQIIDDLSDDIWIGPADPAGWTVKDVVSHVTQWDVAMIGLFRDGVPLEQTLGVAHLWQRPYDYDAINERIRERHAGESIAKIRNDRDAVWIELLAVLESLTDERLGTPGLQLGVNVDLDDNTSLLQTLVDYQGGHYANHRQQVVSIVEGTRLER